MIDHTITVLISLVQNLPIGTNLALLQFLWMLLSGALLPERGAIFPALKAIGLSDAATRRAWAAFRGGVWQIAVLLRLWRAYIESLPNWQVRRHEGYRVIAADITAFWRPALKNCPSKHFHPIANQGLPAVIFGLVGRVGEINGQRLAFPLAFERVLPQDPRESRLWSRLLDQLSHSLAPDEILVVDAGVKIKDLQAAGIERYVVRLASNFAARRNYLPPHVGHGRKPLYGQHIRPLVYHYRGRILPQSPPDRTETWQEEGREIRAEIWEELVLRTTKPDPQAQTFQVIVIHDPFYDIPWLLATSLHLKAATVKAIYQDRWPVEQIPLAAKQMVGAHRQFVHAPESIQRLPELALLAGSILSYLAATAPPVPTGFWDRKPKRTAGRFRRALRGQPFPQSFPFPQRIRKKASCTAHLPKGNLARGVKMDIFTASLKL